MTSMFGNPFYGLHRSYGHPQQHHRHSYFGDEDDYEQYLYAQEMARRRQEQQLRAEETARRQYYEEMRRAEILRRQRLEEARQQELDRIQQSKRRFERKTAPRSEAARRQLRVWTIAATLIQRAYRAHLTRRRETLKITCAERIATWYRAQSQVRIARRALPALAKLGHILNDYRELERTSSAAAFSASPRADGRPAMALLAFEDAILRLLLRLDAVSTGGIEGVRIQRKELANLLNRRLDTVEQAKKQAAGHVAKEAVDEVGAEAVNVAAEKTREDDVDSDASSFMDEDDETAYSDVRSLSNYVAVPVDDSLDGEEGIRAIFSHDDLSLSEDEEDENEMQE